MNPLLAPFNTPHDTIPFERIQKDHYLPALEEAIAEALTEVKVIEENKDKPTFENTIVALERSGDKVELISGLLFNLNSAETSDDIQALAREFSPRLSEYANDIMLNEALFKRVAAVYEQKDQWPDDDEDQRLLEKTYRAFKRNGAALADEGKMRLREIDRRLGELSLKFGENLLAETNEYYLVLEEKDLKGLPDSLVEAAAEEAEARDRAGKYVITLQMPSYLPFMTYAERRDLREKLYRAYGSKAFKGDERDNRDIIREIVALRDERARLLGFARFSDYVLAERMAESTDKVKHFIDNLREKAWPAAQKEMAELAAFARERDELEALMPWDISFYTEKLKQKRFGIDDETLKPYFELNRVIDGVFQVAGKLYDIKFREQSDWSRYHNEVKVYEVLDENDRHLAVLYADFHPRKGKRNGAWMTVYRQQHKTEAKEQRPQVSIVCNFTKSTKSNPSLLTFNEVLTLFHEFGHALHGIMAEGKYSSLTGTNVYWDFVELPSQIMENWCYEKGCLDLFARHYQTDEPIPEELVKKLKESATFMEGRATVRQLSLAALDMTWHSSDPEKLPPVPETEEQVMKEYQLLPPVPETIMSCQFGHIFQGGYAAGYYSYKWAEVLDADAFELFREKGLFNAEVAAKFRKLLAAGGRRHPAEVYREFRGQDPDPDALLRRAGLIEA